MARFLYFVRKFVPALFMPFGLALLLIAIGIVRRRRGPALAGFILLVVAGMPVVTNSLGLLLENQYPRIAADQCPPADAIVALGGFAGENARFPGEIRWYYAVDRFEQAVHLFKLQKAPLLLFTRTQSPEADEPNMTFELVRRAAIEHGVPADAIRITRPVATTADEAAAVHDFLAASGGKRIILVTSAMHMGRAAVLFRRAGVDFTPFPVDYASDKWSWDWGRFVPSPASLDQTEKCLHEIYGDLFYGVFFHGSH
jgi:uncharacterized SAM-binding protein YcdF (DUF218 family)